MDKARIPPPVAYLAQIVVLASMYCVTAYFNPVVASLDGFSVMVWPPTGIVLGAILLVGFRAWPLLWLGAFLLNVFAGVPVLAALALSTSNMLGAIFGAYLLGRFPGFDRALNRLRDALIFMAAAALSTAAIATVSALLLVASGVVPVAHIRDVLSRWALGDLLSDLTLAPLVLIWATGMPRVASSQRRSIEAVALGVVLALVNIIVFTSAAAIAPDARGYGVLRVVLLILNLPLLILAAARFGRRSALLGVSLIYAIGVFGIAGAFQTGTTITSQDELTLLQTGSVFLAGTFFALGTYIFERCRRDADREAALASEQAARVKAEERSLQVEALIVQQKQQEEERARKATQMLEESEERFRSVVELSPDTIIIYRNNEIEYINAAGLELFGAKTNQDLLGKSLFDLTHVDYHPIVHQRLQAIMAGQSVQPIEKKIVRMDGTIRDVEAAASLHVDRRGQATQIVLRDITDRKQSEKALRQSEERFHRIYDSNVLGVAFLSMDGRFLDANEAFCTLLGYTCDEMRAGMARWRDMFPAERITTATAAVEQLKSGGVCIPYESELLHKNGRKVPVLMGAATYSNSKIQIVLFAIDISHFTQREDTLSKSELKYRTMLDSANDAIVSADSFASVIYFNRQAEKIFGYSVAEILGKPLFTLFAARYEEDIRRIAGNPVEARTTELLGMRKDGAEFPLELSVSQWKTAEGSFLTAHIRDITERKRAEHERSKAISAEQALRAEAESAKRRATFLGEASSTLASSLDFATTLASVARLAVPHFADLCNVYIIENHSTLRSLAIEHTNPMKLQTELQLDHSYATSLKDLHGPGAVLKTGKLEWRAQVSDSLLVGMARDDEHLRLLRQRGLKSYISTPMIARGRILGAIMFGITESNRPYMGDDVALAEDLAHRAAIAVDNAILYRETQQALFTAERAVTSREQLIAIVSHDLKNPLNAISLGAAAAQKSIEAIRHSVSRMDRLTADLLDIASIDASSLSIKRQPTAGTHLIDQIREMFEPAASAKGIRLRYELAPDLPLLDIDPGRIVQVLSNLIGNSVKFLPSGGEIIIRAGMRGEVVCFSVSDNGPGIPEDQFDHIFDRHWQARETAHLGTGLGLAIAKGIVENHGGQIWLNSKVGEGATFYFTVPAVKTVEHVPELQLQPQH